MTILRRLFAPLQLAVSPGQTLYTADVNTRCKIVALTATNTTATARYVTVYIVPSAGAKGVTNAVVWQKVVPANGQVSLYDAINHILNPGDFIVAEAEAAAAITLAGSGVEVTTN